MQSPLRLVAAALLAAIVFSGTPIARAADPDTRAALIGRQKIRAELAAAMANGNLSPRDQYRLLLKAKDVLSPRDFEGFQRTLDRLASTNAVAAAPRVERPAGVERTVAVERTAAMERPAEKVRGRLRGMLEAEDTARETEASYEDAEGAAAPEVVPTPGPRLQDQGPADVTQPYVEGCGPEGCGPEGCGEILGPRLFGRRRMVDECDSMCRPARGSLELFSTVDAFKGPADLDNLNGNFGTRFGLNSSVMLSRRLGIGAQAGTSVGLYDFHGTPFTDAGHRTQEFITVGMFQRIPVRAGTFSWGFGYDWLIDDYYSNLHFGQWRVKLAYEFTPCDEIGIWSAIQDRGDSALVGNPETGFLDVHLKPLTQGNIYWRHTWMNDASVTARFGVAEQPGEFIFGADGRYPLTERLNAISSFNYVLPSARSGLAGQSEEFWNVSVGIELVLGRGRTHCCSLHDVSPLLPLADNGSFGVRRL